MPQQQKENKSNYKPEREMMLRAEEMMAKESNKHKHSLTPNPISLFLCNGDRRASRSLSCIYTQHPVLVHVDQISRVDVNLSAHRGCTFMNTSNVNASQPLNFHLVNGGCCRLLYQKRTRFSLAFKTHNHIAPV